MPKILNRLESCRTYFKTNLDYKPIYKLPIALDHKLIKQEDYKKCYRTGKPYITTNMLLDIYKLFPPFFRIYLKGITSCIKPANVIFTKYGAKYYTYSPEDLVTLCRTYGSFLELFPSYRDHYIKEHGDKIIY